MRLIDATKAIEGIDEIVCSMSVCINSDYYKGMRAMKDMALHAIEKQPTVNAVEVVRCKDCRWGKEACGNIECNVDSNLPSEYHGYKWFCPNGEMKDNDRH